MRSVVRHAYEGLSDTFTGTSTTLEAEVLSVEMLGYKNCLFIVGNTDDTNSLSFRVDGFAYQGGLPDDVVEPTTVDAGDSVSMVLLDGYASISFYISDSGSHADFQIDYVLRS